MQNTSFRKSLVDGMRTAEMVLEKLGRLVDAAADVARGHLGRAGTVHLLVVPLGIGEAGEDLGAGQALGALSVGQSLYAPRLEPVVGIFTWGQCHALKNTFAKIIGENGVFA
jgi:hypothetical protein